MPDKHEPLSDEKPQSRPRCDHEMSGERQIVEPVCIHCGISQGNAQLEDARTEIAELEQQVADHNSKVAEIALIRIAVTKKMELDETRIAALEAKLAEAEKPWDNHKTFRDVAEQQIEKQTGYYPEDTVKGLQDVIERMEMVASTECWRIQEKLQAAERERDHWKKNSKHWQDQRDQMQADRDQAEQRARDAEQAALNAEADLATEKHASAFGLREKDVEIARLRDMLHGEETGFDESRLLSGDKGIPVSQRPTPPEEG